MGSIPNWVTTSAKRTLRSRVQFSESPRLLGKLFRLGFEPGTSCPRGFNHSATCAGACLTSLSCREAVLPLSHHDFLPSGSRFVRRICMALPRPREARWRYLGAMLFPMPCFPLLPSRGRNAKYGPYLQIQKYLGPYFAVFTVKKRNTRPQMRIWRLPNSYSTALALSPVIKRNQRATPTFFTA